MPTPPPAAPALPFIRVGLLGGPVVLAFFSGGFFDGPRLWALAVCWLLVAATAVAAPRVLPERRTALAAVAGLALLAAWTGVSRSWAPLDDPAGDDLERTLLYLGAFVATVAAFRRRRDARTVEVAVGAGALVVTLYGLSGRLVPWLVDQTASVSAGGRLEQPLTYWNAQGALAALGAILAVRVAGDRTRPAAVRAGAAAGVAPLVAGVYLSFSRGAVLALVCGVLVLLACAPTWSQVRALGVAVLSSLPVVVAAALCDGVRALEGGTGARNAQGAIVLLVLAGCALGAAALTRVAAGREEDGATRLGRLPLPDRGVGAAVAVACLVAVVVPVLASSGGPDDPAFGASSQRFTDVGSNRDRYWDVALGSFADHPVAGVGAAGFQVEWQRERDVADGVRDAHSLPLETAAELGLVGLAMLALLVGGVALCARAVQREDPALAAGALAGLTVWGIHACLDWDWEMPALTLPALLLAGALVARADALQDSPAAPAPRRG